MLYSGGLVSRVDGVSSCCFLIETVWFVVKTISLLDDDLRL